MDGNARRLLEMGASADEFSVAHPDTDPGYNVSATRLTQLVERGRGLAATQREGVIDVHAAAAQKRTLRRAMLAGPIAHLAELGRLAAREDHELGKSFIFKPSADTYLAFRTAAGTMAAAAQTHKELLMKHGLSESVLNLFVQLLDQFDSAVRLRSTGRAAHMAATRELGVVAAEIGRIVRVMDAHNQERFKNDGQLLGTWISVRTVVGRPRAVSTPKDGSPTQDGTTAPTNGDVRPAA